MGKSEREMMDSPDFKNLVAKRRSITIVLVLATFFVYFGFILLVAFNKPFLAGRIGEFVTMGIPVSMIAIILLWVLTISYTIWANKVYDKEVDRLKSQM